LFLLPLGLAAFLGGAQTAWACGITAVAANLIISFSLYVYRSGDPAALRWGALYFSVMALAFTWINAPLTRFTAALAVPYRIIAGALVCTFVIGPLFLSLAEDPRMHEFVAGRMAALSGSVPSGDFPVTPGELLSSGVYAGLRGGILVLSMIFLWVNRQIAAGILRILRRLPAREGAPAFHAPPVLIWILSLSLGAVLAGRLGEMEPLDIAGWNMLVISATLYFVQGGGIVLYFLLKAPPLMRMAANVGIIILFFTPGLNAAALGALVLLGIAENWVPFRAPKQ
jgi:hypothetical protein